MREDQIEEVLLALRANESSLALVKRVNKRVAELRVLLNLPVNEL
ncbi:MAG: hypothetical protein AABX60_01300 [Nanoarchaeota archaeon]